jgi:diguanylate cyclase (GGDEF)-like protein
MYRYRRAGFASLIMAGLAALSSFLHSASWFASATAFQIFLAGATVWFIGMSWYALRRSDTLAKRTIQKLEHSAIMRLERMARASDPGEGVDYMYLKARLDEEQARIDRHGGVISLLCADLNNLEEVQEKFGQQVADQVLEETSEIIASHLRQFDAFGHLGKTEFLIMLPHTNRRDARRLAESLYEAVKGYSYQFPGGGTVDVIRLAIGISAYPLNGESTEHAVAAARNAMQENKAKKGGGISISEQFIRSASTGEHVVSDLQPGDET